LIAFRREAEKASTATVLRVAQAPQWLFFVRRSPRMLASSARCASEACSVLPVAPQEGSRLPQMAMIISSMPLDAALSACAVVPRDYDDYGDTRNQQQREKTQQSMRPTQRAT